MSLQEEGELDISDDYASEEPVVAAKKPNTAETSKMLDSLYEQDYGDEGPSDYDSEDLEREVLAAQSKKKAPKEKILTKKEIKA